MIPPVGATALFTFATPFALLNGVYSIVKTMTFETALASGVDFVAALYTPAGRTASEYASEYQAYAGQIVLQLQTVTAATVATYYVPLGVLSQVPDPTIQRYDDIYLSIHIGAFADETVYTWIAGQVNDLLASVTGNPDTAQFYSNPSDAIYLTQGQYAALVAQRTANIKTISPLIVQNQKLQQTIDSLQTLIRAYQANLIALYTSQQVIQSNIATINLNFNKLTSNVTIV